MSDVADIQGLEVGQGRSARGGSAARRALRKTGPKAGAVQAGMTGGTYRPLSDHDMERIAVRWDWFQSGRAAKMLG
jgi:trimethylamine:corrinoid methyltransferase-like protein